MRLDDLRPEPETPALRATLDLGSETMAGRGTWTFRRKDDSPVVIEILARTIEFAGRRAALVVGRDVTTQRQTEQALRKVSMAVEQSPSSVIVTDVQGRIEYVNPKFTELTGYTAEEVLGQNPRILKSGETPVEEYRKLWSTITAGGVWRGEFHNKRKDGTLFWERASISPVRDASGTITNFVAVKEDITAQKTLEAQYLHAQKMEAVGRLAGGIAHDFNNMLSVIVGYTDSAMAELDPHDPMYADLEQVRAAAFRSAELTRQLLAFSRRQTILPVVLDLGAQVAGMEGMLRRIIGEDINLEIRSQADVWPVFMDPSQIDQVLANLVVNARDAMPRGGRLIIEIGNIELTDEYAAIHAGCTPGCYVLLTVSDTGIGMDKDTLEHVFEPFFTTKGEGKGTGLGLATVFGIVKQNGGYINVYSETGHGSTFRVYLPRHTGAVPEEDLAQEHAESVRGTETVLLVEDEEMVRELARRVFEQAGYRVIPAAGPGEALAWCETSEEPIHLLLTDVVMPNMNGSELARRIATVRPGIKVLFMSGYTTETIAQSGVLDWGAGFIGKPFDPYKLLAKARAVLDAG